MVTFRLTASLAKKINLKLTDAPSQSTNRLGDWYASDFTLGSRQFILCTSEKGRLPVVIEAAPYKNFHERLIVGLEAVLRSWGISQEKITAELAHSSEHHYAKTADRSVVGTMVDSIKHMEYSYDYQGGRIRDRLQMSEWLADVPNLKLNSYPKKMTMELFNQPRLCLV